MRRSATWLFFLLCLAPAPVAALDPILSATHHGDVSASGIRWSSHYDWHLEGPFTQDHDLEVRYVWPLPAATQLTGSSVRGDLIRDASGRVLGFRIKYPGGHGDGRVELVVPGRVPVRPPLAVARVAQRVELDGVEYRAVMPQGPMERRLLEARHRGLDAALVKISRGSHPWIKRGQISMYVVPDEAFVDAGGVDALIERRQRDGAPTWALACMLALGVIGSLVAFRAVRRHADAEEVDRFLSSYDESP